MASTVERFGRLDIVVANAGGPPPGRALDVDDAALRAALEANLLTSIRLVRAAVPHLRARGWGRVCLLASYSVVQPVPGLALSNTADGLVGVGQDRSRRPLSRRHHPQDVAFLCSAPARSVSGAAVVVDGAATLAL